MRLMPLGFAALTLVSTGLGGLAAIWLRDRLHLLLGFSSGAVLAVALFDILPEVFSFHPGSRVMMATAAGFLLFFALERYTALHRAREHVHERHRHNPELGVIGAAGLALHSFLDGVAIGIGFAASMRVGVLIALSVIAHDLSDGLNTVTVVLAHKNSLKRAASWLLIDMSTPVLGAASTLLFHLDPSDLPWVLAFFAGSFLYIGASDLLPEAQQHDSPLVGVATVAGMAAILAANSFLHLG